MVMALKLVASVMARNEAGRFLEPWVPHLLEFCDAVYAFDDGSTDDTAQKLADLGAVVYSQNNSTFFAHEGQARQRALEWTLSGDPTHIVNLDLDEFVSDGAALRRLVASSQSSEFALKITEIWRALDECLCVRVDGGWRPHLIPALWRVPSDTRRLRIADRALACGRVPVSVDQRAGYATSTGVQLLHFGWANEAERVARHQRYAVADGGRFHRSQHLDSIMWPDSQVAMHPFDWPAGLLPYRDRILDRCNPKERAWQA
jgi:glycosyltransferase involved in cell wall biosynthesis